MLQAHSIKYVDLERLRCEVDPCFHGIVCCAVLCCAPNLDDGHLDDGILSLPIIHTKQSSLLTPPPTSQSLNPQDMQETSSHPRRYPHPHPNLITPPPTDYDIPSPSGIDSPRSSRALSLSSSAPSPLLRQQRLLRVPWRSQDRRLLLRISRV